MTTFQLDKDAFSNGQIASKIWLCEELEKHIHTVDNIWIYGGWYGLTAFLLRVRGNMKIGKIHSFDIDPACEPVADMINENWVFDNWRFKAFTKDCNLLSTHEEVDLVVNTSTEHFENLSWFRNISSGTWVVLQGADMKHDDHVYKFDNLVDFARTFKLKTVLYSGQKKFYYPDWDFTRYMLIGIK